MEDIHWLIFLAKFQENPRLPGRVDSVLRAAGRQSWKFNQLLRQHGTLIKFWKVDLPENIFKSIEGVFDLYCQSDDMIDFHNSHGKMERKI